MMTKRIFVRISSLLPVFLAGFFTGYASEGKPVPPVQFQQTAAMLIADTIPPVKKTVEEKPAQEKPATTTIPSVIKVVPKARKQIKPVALPALPVKPPKIIKPVIKRVGTLIP